MTIEQIKGADIDIRCAVFIRYKPNDRGDFIIATAGEGDDDWGDRAVVIDVKPCTENDGEGCRFLVVAPDETDTIEYVHINEAAVYAVERVR